MGIRANRLERLREGIVGRIRVISTSKIRKTTAIRKNWVENGSRAELIGSKPHSNGEGFSRSGDSFFARRKLIRIRLAEIIKIRGVITRTKPTPGA